MSEAIEHCRTVVAGAWNRGDLSSAEQIVRRRIQPRSGLTVGPAGIEGCRLRRGFGQFSRISTFAIKQSVGENSVVHIGSARELTEPNDGHRADRQTQEVEGSASPFGHGKITHQTRFGTRTGFCSSSAAYRVHKRLRDSAKTSKLYDSIRRRFGIMRFRQAARNH